MTAPGRGPRRPGRRPARSQRGRRLPRGTTFYTPGAGGTRRSLEQASARPLVYLHQLPRWVPPLAMTALLVAGLAVRGWPGAAVLACVAAFLGWLAAISWPHLTGHRRLLRVAGIACVLALAVIQATR